jgi:hypothetical protein
MGLRPTQRDEDSRRRRPRGTCPPRRRGSGGSPQWIPAPRLRGDKLRGNDVTFDAAPTCRGEGSRQFRADPRTSNHPCSSLTEERNPLSSFLFIDIPASFRQIVIAPLGSVLVCRRALASNVTLYTPSCSSYRAATGAAPTSYSRCRAATWAEATFSSCRLASAGLNSSNPAPLHVGTGSEGSGRLLR